MDDPVLENRSGSCVSRQKLPFCSLLCALLVPGGYLKATGFTHKSQRVAVNKGPWLIFAPGPPHGVI